MKYAIKCSKCGHVTDGVDYETAKSAERGYLNCAVPLVDHPGVPLCHGEIKRLWSAPGVRWKTDGNTRGGQYGVDFD